MENIELTSEEKEELEKRGFYAKPLFQIWSFIIGIWFSVIEFLVISFLLIFSISSLIILFSHSDNYHGKIETISLGGSLIYYGYLIIMRSIIYGKGGASYYNGTKVILLGNNLETNKISIAKQILQYKKLGIFLKYPSDLNSTVLMYRLNFRKWYQKTPLSFGKKNNFLGNLGRLFSLIAVGITIVIYLGLTIYLSMYPFKEMLPPEALVTISEGLSYLFVFTIIAILSGVYLRKMNPLGLFVDTASIVQKFTPEIEEQSKTIQSEFKKNQNFSILHSGFEKLSKIFSKIGELVLKLERVEKKANKGNLFDSEKYIDSLRTDIVTPLVELKKFLEGQREELLTSQKELSKVMVGESSELSGNRELASRRGEEVLRELDGNIGKLNIMITKIA